MQTCSTTYIPACATAGFVAIHTFATAALALAAAVTTAITATVAAATNASRILALHRRLLRLCPSRLLV